MSDNFVKASYITPANPRFRGNPLIECLPESLNREEVFDAFCNIPKVTKEIRSLPFEVRLEMVDTLKDFRMPLISHETYALLIDQMIKDGYVHRNPFGYGRPGKVNTRKVERALNSQNYCDLTENVVNCTPSTKFLIGVSGVGKSETIRSIVSRYPTAIRHTEYEGEPFTKVQIPYLYVNLPFIATPFSVCEAIFQKIDQALGVNYYDPDRYSLKNVTRMVSDIAVLIDKYSIGLIIIDEIQGLVNTTRDARELTELFLSVSNLWMCPIFFIGTMKAHKLLGNNMRSTRRFLTDGFSIWDIMDKNSRDWKDTLAMMWKIQYTNVETPLTKEIEEALYNQSQGNLAILVSLFRIVQKNVIQRKGPKREDEVITLKMINYTAQHDFKPFQEFLRAIESKDISRIIEYEDIIPDLDNYDVTVPPPESNTDLKPLTRLQVEKIKEDFQKTSEYLKNNLLAYGGFEYVTSKDLEKIIGQTLVSESWDDLDYLKRTLMKQALDLDEELSKKEAQRVKLKKERRTAQNRCKENTLLKTFLQATESSEDIYQTLKDCKFVGIELQVSL